ncbi:hypothetical protein F5Y19DRAFT_470125 [Xylariaceae sp. FL1651]|nr:hypothetical protein F5Y19DRAFT_470125 [Xylariaceae sp. FL1651]
MADPGRRLSHAGELPVLFDADNSTHNLNPASGVVFSLNGSSNTNASASECLISGPNQSPVSPSERKESAVTIKQEGEIEIDVIEPHQGVPDLDHCSPAASNSKVINWLEAQVPIEPFAEPVVVPSTQCVFPHLQKAMAVESMDLLDRHRSSGARILEKIAQRLSINTSCTDILRLSQSIKNLTQQAKAPQTILGVIGGTGHGKSSLINALLGETRLVPTSCFRACTAVPTELSWNFSDDLDHLYSAEIEFISEEEWHSELIYLYNDLLASSGEVSTEGEIEKSDAGVAWAKIKAVFPKLTKQTIGQTDAKTLGDDPAVNNLLGTIKTVRERTASALYEGIRVYVDSKKAAVSATSDGDEVDTERKMELWPLIKVVRIYTKADVLSTGAVIVDLPGVQDSNAARAAIAEKYIEKCHGLWVVSMITRAVNNKTAQELLGTHFKQQLKLDGNYSNVTFICSKTDDINANEDADSLGLSEESERLRNAKSALAMWQTSGLAQLERYQKRKEAISVYADELDKHLDRWGKLSIRQAKGKMVNPPTEIPRKRKSDTNIAKRHKRRRVTVDEASPEATQYVSTEDCWESLERNIPQFPANKTLTEDDIQSMIEYLRSQKLSALDEKDKLQQKIEDCEDQQESLEEEVFTLQHQLRLMCISRRNDFSREAIRDQFALGLKELDQQDAQHIDADNFDPEKELRNYNEIGRSLPVFCISSRAYQSIKGHEETEGFNTLDDTEIPQLRAHTIKLTEVTQIRSIRAFLNEFIQILNSLYMWSSKDGSEVFYTAEEKKVEIDYIKEQVNELEKLLRATIEDCFQQVSRILKELYTHFDVAALYAADRAPEISRGWPSHKHGDGGLPCNSYKATCRRNGVFSGNLGPRDFNRDLAAPLLQSLSSVWEITFSKKIPDALNTLVKIAQKPLQSFNSRIINHLQKKVVFPSIINMLQDQDKARVSSLTNKTKSLELMIIALQREANRSLTPAIQKKLRATYSKCTEDKGRGVFARIQMTMAAKIRSHCRIMLKSSCRWPEKILSEIPGNIRYELEAYIAIMRDEIVSDYSNVVLGSDVTKNDKVVREGVLKLLKDVDNHFQ